MVGHIKQINFRILFLDVHLHTKRLPWSTNFFWKLSGTIPVLWLTTVTTVKKSFQMILLVLTCSFQTIANTTNIVGRGVLTPFFFFQILSNPTSHSPCRLQPPPPMFFLLSSFFGWIGDRTTFDWLFCLMIMYYGSAHVEPWYTCTRRTLIMFYATRHQVYWGRHIMRVFAGTLIWYHTQTHIHTHIKKTHSTLRDQ